MFVRSHRSRHALHVHGRSGPGPATRGLLCAMVAALATVACQDRALTGPEGPAPSALIVDGANNGGNDHFYWLRPMVKAPSTFPGTFDPTLGPEIRICALTADETACDGPDVATFSTTSGSGSEIVRMEPAEEHYIVNWHTGRYNLDPARNYRIRAYVGTYLLGLADVEVGSTMKELKNVNTGEFIALLDGRTLPIKFRIEEGAVPSGVRGAISAGGNHSCALDAQGKAYCWGNNLYGQLGSGSHVNSSSPVAVQTVLSFTDIGTGNYHTCALSTDGIAHCWGYGSAGNLGNGTDPYSQATPVAVSGGHTFLSLTVGTMHACGQQADGVALCWGYNFFGQLGEGSVFTQANTPQAVMGGYAFSSLSAGTYHTCGVRSSSDPALDGAALCWGYNNWGQLGNGSIIGSVSSPTAVAGGHRFASIDAGTTQSCALKADGSAYCWGLNYLGTGGTGSYAPGVNLLPVAVAGGLAFRSLTAGTEHNCAIRRSSDLLLDGVAYCWGRNDFGQVGNGSAAYVGPNVPTAVIGTDTYVALDAGGGHTCGVTTAGVGKCWGLNATGQLGDGTPGSFQSSPSTVAGGITFATP